LQHAYLLLEDGTRLEGTAFGAEHESDGEVVFNTGMVGYPETMTDPSYQGQILVCTYPLIGNYGVPGNERENGLYKNFESEAIHVQALIVTEYSREHSHWAAEQSLQDWMRSQNIPGIQCIDTRMLTKKLREQGSMLGRIVYDEDAVWTDVEDPNKRDLAGEVSVSEPTLYQKGKKKIAVVDCGTKNNILQAFLRRDISVLRVPFDYDALGDNVDGIVFSNGPGDPKMCHKTIENAKRAMDAGMPVLGICLGSQILALACGADTYKLKYGHRSHNQPVNEAGTRRCYITSQNHGFAIDATTLPQDWRDWFVNDNDGTNEGIIHISKPFFGAQFHPEASPGPDDTEFIFDMFVRALK
jgi:carbamoyl-phosphate synthase small subunit